MRVRGLFKSRSLLLTAGMTLAALISKAQGSVGTGVSGITVADTEVRKYFEPGTKLMYAVGAVLGLVGAVKVFQKWNAGDQDTNKVAAAWFGSCIFLVVVATILKAFFAVS